ncbi:chemotaxis response regulator protein-glutamate methylesterase [Moritella sp. Urea-trap-13]|uniref:protein-glutamate methylesterase/protein-glutamine glutaminase n=1 Tax=Moritella sp. Urea-trap-13 TaxID=2058327 RepID=UPI000C32EDD4|nr:chemotaxis response regulator protein-glutamate methylesterase [Moritella sp. Urea-trap-13]PKH07845.1 chemotaxis response regulator protein-glutamate methylesterase [Moritella sp. Urea-trap-13]
MPKIKVLLVDDSAVVRQVLTQIINAHPKMEVCAAAQDPIFAMRHMHKQWPDVIILDVEMPRMDGITFLRKIMSERPTPVVMCSSLTEKGADTTMQAMSLGAIEIVTKPKLGVKGFLSTSAAEIIHAVLAAAQAKIAKCQPITANVSKKLTADAMLSLPNAGAMVRTTERIVAIGSSTGGTTALEAILTQLPRVSPGIVIVQHMPVAFTEAFAARLNSLCEMDVVEAKDNDTILPGHVYIAPGDRHLLISRCGALYKIAVKDGPLVSRHKPSVDVLFRSVARYAGKNALGIILTGMGDDGARGLKEMKDAGCATLGECEKSCIVYGMPKEAMKRGAVEKELSLAQFPSAILAYYRSGL